MAIDYGTIIDAAARSDSINQNGLVIDMEGQTKLLDEDSYFFEALTRKVGAIIQCNRMKHEYRVRRLIPSYSEVSADSAAAATSVYIKDYTRIKLDFLVYNARTGDLMEVTAKPTTTTCSVVKATDGSSGTGYAWVAGDIIVIMGEAHAEGEEVPAAFANDSTNEYDYVMQKDRRVESTDIEEAEEHYDPREKRALDRKLAWIEYKRDMNLLFYLGKRTREVTSAGGPRRHICGGLIEKLTENVTDFSQVQGGFTLEALSNILGDTKYHSQSSEAKIMLAGTKVWASMSAWPRDFLQVSPNATTWGIAINRILTAHGGIDIGYDPMLNAKNGLSDRFFILDTAHIRQLQMKGLPMRMILDVPNLSTIHTSVDAITGTFGLQVVYPELHASGTGIQ